MIELLQNLEEILHGVQHHICILPKPGSKCETEIAKADHLDPNNYDEYLFDGRIYYATNETSASIMVMSDFDLTKLQGGGGSMFARTREEFMTFTKTANPQSSVQIEDKGIYPFIQVSLCIESNIVNCPKAVISELCDRIIPFCQFNINYNDLMVVYTKCSMPRLPEARYKAVDCYKLMATRGMENDVAHVIDTLPNKVDPVKYPTTHRWHFLDYRLSEGYRAAYFTNIFDQQRQFYSNRIQMSIEEIIIDLMSEIPQCLGLDGKQNKLTFQQLMVSGYPVASLDRL